MSGNNKKVREKIIEDSSDVADANKKRKNKNKKKKKKNTPLKQIHQQNVNSNVGSRGESPITQTSEHDLDMLDFIPDSFEANQTKDIFDSTKRDVEIKKVMSFAVHQVYTRIMTSMFINSAVRPKTQFRKVQGDHCLAYLLMIQVLVTTCEMHTFQEIYLRIKSLAQIFLDAEQLATFNEITPEALDMVYSAEDANLLFAAVTRLIDSRDPTVQHIHPAEVKKMRFSLRLGKLSLIAKQIEGAGNNFITLMQLCKTTTFLRDYDGFIRIQDGKEIAERKSNNAFVSLSRLSQINEMISSLNGATGNAKKKQKENLAKELRILQTQLNPFKRNLSGDTMILHSVNHGLTAWFPKVNDAEIFRKDIQAFCISGNIRGLRKKLLKFLEEIGSTLMSGLIDFDPTIAYQYVGNQPLKAETAAQKYFPLESFSLVWKTNSLIVRRKSLLLPEQIAKLSILVHFTYPYLLLPFYNSSDPVRLAGEYLGFVKERWTTDESNFSIIETKTRVLTKKFFDLSIEIESNKSAVKDTNDRTVVFNDVESLADTEK
jgi:hypothetical protein